MPSDRSANPALDFPPAGGEMAELVFSMDWSATPIGASENWSMALRTMVRILLANRFPQLLWWGPEYISIYNDAWGANTSGASEDRYANVGQKSGTS